MALDSMDPASADDAKLNIWDWEHKTIFRAPHPEETRVKRVRSMPNLSHSTLVEPQKYAYGKLTGSHSIRLLHIDSVDRERYIVRGWLQEVQDITDVAAGYLALSYTWGSPLMKGYEADLPFRPRFRLILSPRGIQGAEDYEVAIPKFCEFEQNGRQIVLNTNYEIPLVQNLSDFFLTVDLTVAFEALGGKPLPLWIDAVCINQQDSDEVQRYIRIMGDVYNFCRKTLVWLGPDCHDLGGLEWILGEAGEAIIKSRPEDDELLDPGGPHGHWLSGSNVMTESFWQGRSVNIPPVAIHEAIKDFLPLVQRSLQRGNSAFTSLVLSWLSWCRFFNSRAWFHRAWVMQEVAARPGAFVVVGTLHFSWERLFDLDRTLCWSGHYVNITQILIPALGLDGKIHGPRHDMYLGWFRIFYKLYFPSQFEKALSNSRDIKKFEGGELFFQVMEVLMHHSRRKKSSVARDKVACVLGIAHRVLPKLPVPNDLIRALYSSPEESAKTAFSNLQMILLRADEHRFLALLRLIHHSSNDAMLAKPSWVVDWSAENVPDPFEYGRERYLFGDVAAPQILRLMIGSDERRLAGIDGDSLIVYAASFSSVAASFRTIIAPTSHALSAVLEVLSLLGPTYRKTGDPLEVALFAVMTASSSPTGFIQSSIDHFCNMLANVTIIGLGSLLETGFTVRTAFVGESTVFWSMIADDSEDVKEDFLGLHRFPPISSGTSKLIEALRCAESALLRAIGYITRGPQGVEEDPDWTWEPSRPPGELALRTYQQHILRDRALFVTDDGFLGLGPGISEPGDVLCHIAGRPVPCLLRRVPDPDGGENVKYWFVGEVWVHGMMCGEWLESENAPLAARIELV